MKYSHRLNKLLNRKIFVNALEWWLETLDRDKSVGIQTFRWRGGKHLSTKQAKLILQEKLYEKKPKKSMKVVKK